MCIRDRSTGGLVVLPGSHHQHEAMCARASAVPEQGDFVVVPPNDPVLHAGGPARFVCAAAGDMILWDSRTVHCNTPAPAALAGALGASAEDASPDGGWQLIRQVGYVCMTPKSLASTEVLEARREGFVNNVSCSHWPHRFVAAGHALMDTPEKDPLAIGVEQRRLIGYEAPTTEDQNTRKQDTKSCKSCSVS
eukprot:TRINITY_DN13861_c0_g1_i2.p2 TRINITY_DN13861_c0_g1~~TRINITY_DN13861_c0_g1_i2.p2  ORF type:complete len:193 (-),score=36.38 TRINITY_DN13861_c0_g1_i2:113-691(-)